MHKVCLIEVTTEAWPVFHEWFTNHLPRHIVLSGRRKRWDRDTVDVKLEGAGLPEWCAVQEGAPYVRAVASVRNDQLCLAPGTGMAAELFENPQRIQEQNCSAYGLTPDNP